MSSIGYRTEARLVSPAGSGEESLDEGPCMGYADVERNDYSPERPVEPLIDLYVRSLCMDEESGRARRDGGLSRKVFRLILGRLEG